MNKNASNNKVLHEEIKFLKRRLNNSKTIAIGKSFMKNWIKNKIFFCTTVSKLQEILTLNKICDGAKQIYPKKLKKCSKKRYSTNFSHGRFNVKRYPLQSDGVITGQLK